MKDPYEVLGLSSSATDAEIKKAYREQAKKYHPDNYADNPLSDLANEKMKEINEAYDEILRQRAGGYSGSSQSSGYTGSAEFHRVRELVSGGRYSEAEVLLDGMPNHNAEWYYLKGLCYMYTNRYNDAAECFQTANQMDPTNREYASMYQRFRGAQGNFGAFGNRNPSRNGGVCDLCTTLICADCLCECCGGDLISCC